MLRGLGFRVQVLRFSKDWETQDLPFENFKAWGVLLRQSRALALGFGFSGCRDFGV